VKIVFGFDFENFAPIAPKSALVELKWQTSNFSLSKNFLNSKIKNKQRSRKTC